MEVREYRNLIFKKAHLGMPICQEEGRHSHKKACTMHQNKVYTHGAVASLAFCTSQQERLLWAGRLTERRSRGPRTDQRCPTLHEANTTPVGYSHGVIAPESLSPSVPPSTAHTKLVSH